MTGVCSFYEWISWLSQDTIKLAETFPLLVAVIVALILGMFFLASSSSSSKRTTKVRFAEEKEEDKVALNKRQKKELKNLECTVKYEK